MEPGSLSSCCTSMSRVFTNYGVFSVNFIRTEDNYLLGVRRGGQHTNRVARVNINGICNRIRGISRLLFGQGLSAMRMGSIFKAGLTP